MEGADPIVRPDGDGRSEGARAVQQVPMALEDALGSARRTRRVQEAGERVRCHGDARRLDRREEVDRVKEKLPRGGAGTWRKSGAPLPVRDDQRGFRVAQNDFEARRGQGVSQGNAEPPCFPGGENARDHRDRITQEDRHGRLTPGCRAPDGGGKRIRSGSQLAVRDPLTLRRDGHRGRPGRRDSGEALGNRTLDLFAIEP